MACSADSVKTKLTDGDGHFKPLAVKVEKADKHYGPEEGAYKNDSKPRGAVFIANFMKFSDPELRERDGSDTNVRHLKELFSQMEYSVIECITDESKDGTLCALDKFRKLNIHNNVDSLVVIISSHGQDEAFFTSDGKLIHHKEVYNMFSDKNCSALHKKPKLFMFQFCRNETYGHGGRPTRMRNVWDVSATHVCLATSEGRRAYRTFENGALFFFHVCKVFMENAKDYHLEMLMKMVQKSLPEKQKPEVKSIKCGQTFYFNPPLKDGDDMTSECSGITAVSFSPEEKTRLEENIGDDSDVYEISSSPKGKVLIINNMHGCDEDIEKLCNLFCQIGFSEIDRLTGISYAELRKHLELFKDLEHLDAAILVFYGQGFEDHLAFSDNIAISYKDFSKLLEGNRSQLAGKPKILIFQTHQIQSDDFTIAVTDDHCEPNDDDEESETICKDTVIFSVELEGQNEQKSSLLTRALLDVFHAEENQKTELLSLFRLTTNRLEEFNEGSGDQYFVVMYNYRFQKDCYILSKNDSNVDGSFIPSQNIASSIPVNIPQCRTPMRGKNIYPNTSYPRGKALIISFTEYNSENLPPCYWHSGEEKAFKQLCEQLGYLTSVARNCTRDEVMSALLEVRTADSLKEADSLMIIVFGFAPDLNHFYDVRGSAVPVLDILHQFSERNCQKMEGKPKLFFFHMTLSREFNLDTIAQTSEDQQNSHTAYLITTALEKNKGYPREGLNILLSTIQRNVLTTDLESLLRDTEEALLNQNSNSYERVVLRPIKFSKDFYFNPRRYVKE